MGKEEKQPIDAAQWHEFSDAYSGALKAYPELRHFRLRSLADKLRVSPMANSGTLPPVMKLQITNSTLQINNQTVHLLDDRAVDGVWVDTEHLTEPYPQFNIDGKWETPNNIPGEWFGMELRSAVRFKHPDRMKVVWEYQAQSSKTWHVANSEFDFEHFKVVGCEIRQRFILKDREQEQGCPFDEPLL